MSGTYKATLIAVLAAFVCLSDASISIPKCGKGMRLESKTGYGTVPTCKPGAEYGKPVGTQRYEGHTSSKTQAEHDCVAHPDLPQVVAQLALEKYYRGSLVSLCTF